METEYSHDQVDDKKWESIFYEFEFALLKQQTLEDKEQLVLLFESIEKKYREKNASKYYVEMWKVAFKVGKIKLAKS